MNYIMTTQQQKQVNAEQSRRLHDLLSKYDADLNALEADPTRYTVAEYNLRWQAIQQNRAQTRQAIEQIF